MIWADAARQIRGAFRIGHRDPAGLADIDVSLDGYWRSFRAAFLVLPAYLVLQLSEPNPGADPAVRVIVDAIAYVIYWTVMPVLMLHVTALLDRTPRYTAYVVADNWSQIPQTYIWALIGLLASSDMVPDMAQTVATIMAVLWIVSFKFAVARITLGIGVGAAVAIVLLDIIAGLIVSHCVKLIGG